MESQSIQHHLIKRPPDEWNKSDTCKQCTVSLMWETERVNKIKNAQQILWIGKPFKEKRTNYGEGKGKEEKEKEKSMCTHKLVYHSSWKERVVLILFGVDSTPMSSVLNNYADNTQCTNHCNYAASLFWNCFIAIFIFFLFKIKNSHLNFLSSRYMHWIYMH